MTFQVSCIIRICFSCNIERLKFVRGDILCSAFIGYYISKNGEIDIFSRLPKTHLLHKNFVKTWITPTV